MSKTKEVAKVAQNQLPAAYMDGNADGVDTSAVGGVPYIKFLNIKSPTYAELTALLPGAKEPDPVLVRPVPEPPLLLSPLKLHVMYANQVWAQLDENTGDPIEVQSVRPEWGSQKNLREIIEAVVFAYSGERVIPARITFKGGLCTGAAAAAKTLKMAAKPDWFSYSDAHKATANISAAFARFTATFTVSQRTARTTGRKYYVSDARILPTTEAEYSLFVQEMSKPESIASLRAVVANYQRRVAFLQQAM